MKVVLMDSSTVWIRSCEFWAAAEGGRDPLVLAETEGGGSSSCEPSLCTHAISDLSGEHPWNFPTLPLIPTSHYQQVPAAPSPKPLQTPTAPQASPATTPGRSPCSWATAATFSQGSLPPPHPSLSPRAAAGEILLELTCSHPFTVQSLPMAPASRSVNPKCLRSHRPQALAADTANHTVCDSSLLLCVHGGLLVDL